MDNSSNESKALMAMKAAIVATTSTAGWTHIRKFAERVVVDMERTAIDEEDDAKGSMLRREAKSARKFLNDLLSRIELAQQVTDEPTEKDFLDIACD